MRAFLLALLLWVAGAAPVAAQAPASPEPPLLRRIPGFAEGMDTLPPFLRDTALNLHVRSFYMDRLNSNETANEAWAMGGWLAYKSGWLADTFAVGATGYTSQPLYAAASRDGTTLLAPGQESIVVLGELYAQLRFMEYALLTGYRQQVNDGYVNYENQGAETLLFMYLKQLQAKRTKRALLIAFDSSFPFAVGERRLGLRSLPFSILNFDFSRIPSIMEERARTYQALFFRSLQTEGVFPDSKTMVVVALRHTDAKWADDMSDLPPACKAEPEPLKTPSEVVERIAEIPTRLAIASECDRQLLAATAAKLVTEHRGEILDIVNRQ